MNDPSTSSGSKRFSSTSTTSDNDDNDDDDNSSSSGSSYFSQSSASASVSTSSSASSPRSPLYNIPFLRQRRRKATTADIRVADGNDDGHEQTSSMKILHKTIGTDSTNKTPKFHWSSWLLSVTMTVWFIVQAWEFYHPLTTGEDALLSPPSPPPRRIRPPENFWTSKAVNNTTSTTKNRKNMEDMPDGCRFPYSWQTTSFPDCNRLHEIDLKLHLQLQYQRPETMEYYVHSGLWRDVFSMKPDLHTSVVMKLMKLEHDMDLRNLDRHRRDALTMERLTSSPNVVDIYGFCGNTVLTEQATMGLDRRVKQGNISIQQKIQMALDAARGVAALHAMDIIHADIQTQQFLLDAKGTVKINDFNRCRFLPRNNASQICPIQIPSAPGLWRSPEEYTGQLLVQAMDVFSLGNVLHDILVGQRPFQDLGATQLKRKIMNGVHPDIITDNELARQLAALIQKCLEHDVDKRITADYLVQELELLINTSNANPIVQQQ